MALSSSKLSSLLNKPQSKRFELSDRDGLSVRVTLNGSITFQYRYRFLSTPKRLTLGRFPDLTLAQARDKIPHLRQLLKDGKDPIVELRRVSTSTNKTLDYCVSYFLTKHVSKLRPKTQKLYEYTLKKFALGAFDFSVEEVTVDEWYNYFDHIEDNHSAITAQDMLIRLKTCIRYCIKRTLV